MLCILKKRVKVGHSRECRAYSQQGILVSAHLNQISSITNLAFLATRAPLKSLIVTRKTIAHLKYVHYRACPKVVRDDLQATFGPPCTCVHTQLIATRTESITRTKTKGRRDQQQQHYIREAGNIIISDIGM